MCALRPHLLLCWCCSQPGSHYLLCYDHANSQVTAYDVISKQFVTKAPFRARSVTTLWMEALPPRRPVMLARLQAVVRGWRAAAAGA